MRHWRVPVDLLVADESATLAARAAERALGAVAAELGGQARARLLLGPPVRAAKRPPPLRPGPRIVDPPGPIPRRRR